MKSFIVALCVIAVAAASSSDESAKVNSQKYELSPEGSYNFGYETENGIYVQASGALKTFGKDESAIEVTGSNQYKSPEGETISLNYIANENGYQPQGAHLPTPPAPQPIPEYILRSLEYIAAHPHVEKVEKKY